MRRFHLPVWLVFLAATADALAQEDEPDAELPSVPGPAAAAKSIPPPGIDYPALQALGGGSALYIDHTYETSDDLSTFYWVARRWIDEVTVSTTFNFNVLIQVAGSCYRTILQG